MKRWFTFEEIAKELEIPLQSFYFIAEEARVLKSINSEGTTEC